MLKSQLYFYCSLAFSTTDFSSDSDRYPRVVYVYIAKMVSCMRVRSANTAIFRAM